MGIEEQSPMLIAHGRNLASQDSEDANIARIEAEFGIKRGQAPQAPQSPVPAPNTPDQTQPQASESTPPDPSTQPPPAGESPPGEPGTFDLQGQLSQSFQQNYAQPAKRAANFAKDIAGGALDTVQAVGNAAIDVTAGFNKWMAEKGIGQGDLIDPETKLDFANQVIPQPEDTADKMVRSTAQFILPFVTAAGALGEGSALVKFAKGAAINAGINFATVDPEQKRLSDFIQHYPMLANPVAALLESHPDDTHIEARAKNAIEGILLDAGLATTLTGVVKGLKWASGKAVRAAPKVVQAANEGTPAITGAGSEIPPVVPRQGVKGSAPTNPFPPPAPLPQMNTVEPMELFNVGPAMDKSGNLNLTKFDQDTDIMNMIKNFDAANGPQLEQARGEVQSDAEVAQLAKELNTPLDKLLERRGRMTHVELTKTRMFLAQAAQNVQELAEKAIEGSDMDKVAFQKALETYGAIRATLAGQSAAAGRMLRAHQIVIGNGDRQLGESVSKMVELLGGRDQLSTMAQAVAETLAGQANKAASLSKLAARTGTQKGFDAVMEWVVGNVLGPATIALKATSDMATTAATVAERYVAERIALIGGKNSINAKALEQIPGIKAELMQIEGQLTQAMDYPTTKKLLDQKAKLSQALINAQGVQQGEARAMVEGLLYNADKSQPGIQIMSQLESVRDGIVLAWKNARAEGLTGTVDKVIAASKQTQNPFMSSAGMGFHPPAITSENIGFSGDNFVVTAANKTIDVLGAGSRFWPRAVGTQDAFAKLVNYRMNVRALAYNDAISKGLTGQALVQHVNEMVANPSPAIKLMSQSQAAVNTYTNQLEGAWKSMNDFVQKGGNSTFGVAPLRLIAPFTRITMNMTDAMIQRAPFGIGYILPSIKAEIAAGGRRAAMAHSKMAVGTMFSTMAFGLSAAGVIVGSGPANPEMRKLLAADGIQPHTINIAGHSFSYSLAQPFGRVLDAIADITAAFGGGYAAGKTAQMTEIATFTALALGHMVTPEFLMHSFGPLLDAINNPDGRDAAKTMGHLAAGTFEAFMPMSGMMRTLAHSDYFPGGSSQMRVTDSHLEGVAGALQTMKNQFSADLPGFGHGLPPTRNLWGEPVHYPAGIGADIANSFFQNKVDESPATKELIRLGLAGTIQHPELQEGETQLGIRLPNRNVTASINQDRMSFKLDNQQYDRLVTLSAGEDLHGVKQTLKERISEQVTNDWPELGRLKNDENKKIWIRSTISDYQKAARKQLRLEDRSIDDKVKTVLNSNMTVRMGTGQ